MADSFKIKVDDEALKKLIKKLEGGLKGQTRLLKKGWKAVGIDVLSKLLKRFDKFSQGGGNWKKLDPRTMRAKQNKGEGEGSPLILIDNGILRGSLNADDQTEDTIFDAKNDSVTVGTGTPYAIYHQKGKGVPKREIIPKKFPANEEREIAEVFDDALQKAINQLDRKSR